MPPPRSSTRLKTKRSLVRPLEPSELASLKVISEIVESSTKNLEEFIQAFQGFGNKQFDAFFNGLNKAQFSECWTTWENFFSKSDPVILGIFVNLLKSSDQQEPIEPVRRLLLEVNPLLSSNEPTDQQLLHNIALLCEKHLKQFSSSNEHFASNLLIYLLKKNLKRNFSPSTAKRILCVMNECSSIEAQDKGLEPWILQTMGEKAYYLNKEGIKCLTFIVVKSKYNLGSQVHEMVKTLLPGMNVENIFPIGDLYKKIWLKYSSNQKENFQQDCIQDLMYHGVLANRSLPKESEIFPQILRLLDPFHQDKNNKSIQSMLCNLWEPILWRNLRAPNPQVRCNAAEFLFKAFPCEDPFVNLEERALGYDSQIKVMKDLLLDQDVSVRLIAVKGVCQILSSYWAFLTSESIAELTGILVKRCSRDGDSVQIRIAVFNGLSDIVKDASMSHVYLKSILPNLRDSLRDVNENVRLAMLELLSVVKGVKYITYWEICPLDDLLDRLASDSSPVVCRRLVKLIFNSFFPMKESESVKLERCVFLIEKDVEAAKKFYQHSNKYMKLLDAVKFMLTILVSFKRHLNMSVTANETRSIIGEDDDSYSDKENAVNQENQANTSQESTMVDTSLRDEPDAFLSDFNVMNDFLDILTVLWISRYEDLIKEENVEYLAVLEKKTTKIMTNMFRIYKGTDMSRKIIYLCSLFSQNSVNAIVKHCLSNLKNTEFQDFEESDRLYRKSVISSWRGTLISQESQDYSIFIDALCNWKKGYELLEFILYGIEKGFENVSDSHGPMSQSSKRRKSVRFLEKDQKVHLKSISFLSYIFRHSINKQRLISKNSKELMDIYHELSKISNLVRTELRQVQFNEDGFVHEYVYYTWETYLKSMLIFETDKDKITQFALDCLKSLSPSNSALKYPVIKAFLLFLGNAFSLSKVMDGGLIHEAMNTPVNWISDALQENEDEAFEISYLVMSLLGEIFEWSLYQPNLSLLELHQCIMGFLNRLLLDLRINANVNVSLLQDFKTSLISFITSIKTFSQTPYSFFNLMKTISQIIVDELSSTLEEKKDEEEIKDNLESELVLPKMSKIKELPPVSLLLFNCVYPKHVKHLLEELRISLQIRSIKDNKILSALVFLYPLALDEELKVSKRSLQDCLTQLESSQIKENPGAIEMMKSIRDTVCSAT